MSTIATPQHRLRRPRQWGVSPARLAAPFAGMWYKLEMFFPFWEEAGDGAHLRDIAPTATARAGTQVFNRVFTGSVRRASAADGRSLAVATTDELSSFDGIPSMGVNRSCMCVFTLNALPTGTAWVWGMKTGGTYLHDAGVTSTGQPFFYEVTGVVVTATGTAGAIVPGRRHCMVWVARSGTGILGFLDGALHVAVSTAATFLALGAGMRGQVGSVASPFTSGWSGHLTAGAYWNRALTDGEAIALSADPWGLIRPARTYVPFPGGGGGGPGGGTSRSFVPGIIG